MSVSRFLITAFLIAAAGGLLGIGIASAQEFAPIGVSPRELAAVEKSESIMQRALQRKGLLAQYQVLRYAYAADHNPSFRAIFGQYLSWYQTFIGDYPDALLSFSIRQTALPDDAPSPLGTPGYHAVPALGYIPVLAKNYKAVFLNEAHNLPMTRTLTVQLLKQLRAEGFDYFAAETLYRKDKDLQQRGYPIAGSGFYTEEPIYAEMVRTALKLGFKVIAYEADDEHIGDAREAQQAQNLYRIFEGDPNARIVVNGGYAHIQEQGQFLGAESMAEHFRKLSGIDPLTIEQTMLISHDSSAMDHPDYDAIVHALNPKQPVVFVDTDGKPWSLRPGYDVSVIFPLTQISRGRPTWLSLGDLRAPYFISNECANTYPCLVEARYVGEDNNAIPADRMVLDPVPLMTTPEEIISLNRNHQPSGDLYLRPGKYVLTTTDEHNQLITRGPITVSANLAQNP